MENDDVKIVKKGTRLKRDGWRDICVPSAVAKRLAKIIMGRIKQRFESLIHKEQATFRSPYSCMG